jgi:hypothetical protein
LVNHIRMPSRIIIYSSALPIAGCWQNWTGPAPEFLPAAQTGNLPPALWVLQAAGSLAYASENGPVGAAVNARRVRVIARRRQRLDASHIEEVFGGIRLTAAGRMRIAEG